MKTTRIPARMFRHPVQTREGWIATFDQLETTLTNFRDAVLAAKNSRPVRTVTTERWTPNGPASSTVQTSTPADTTTVLLDRIGDLPERTMASVLGQVETARARHDADLAVVDGALDAPPEAATADELTQRAYFGSLVAASLTGANTARAIDLAEAAIAAPDVIANPQYAAAWADRLEALRHQALNEMTNGMSGPTASVATQMRSAARLNAVIETLRRPAMGADRRSAVEGVELLRTVNHQLRFVENTARPRVDALITRAGQASNEKIITDRFGGIWALDFPAPDQRRRYGSYSDPVELATALGRNMGLTASAALDWYLPPSPLPSITASSTITPA
jgi:hypothetical protein